MAISSTQTTNVQPEVSGKLIEVRRFFCWLVLILIAGACLYFIVAATTPKFNRAEVFFAECTREMLRCHNFITPLYHNKPFFDKPILTYWLILGCFKTLGISHLTARIPSIMAAAVTILITTVGAAFVGGVEAGILSGMILATSAMFVSFAGLCMSDMLLVAFDTITLTVLFIGTLFHNQRTLLWWLGALTAGLAFLTKGPIGIVLPVLEVVTYLAFTKQLHLVRLKHLLLGLLTIVAVNSPWFLAALKINGIGALYYFFVHENLQRFAGSTYDTHHPIWFMASSLFAGFLPWSILLLCACGASLRRLSKDIKDINSTRSKLEFYLWLWIVFVIGFFSFSRGKIDYYALPAYPACAALCGIYLSDWIHKKNKLAVINGALLSLGFIALGVCCWTFTHSINAILQSYKIPVAISAMQLLPAIPVILGVVSLVAVMRNRAMLAYTTIFLNIVLTGIVFCTQITPVFSQLQAPLEFINIVKNIPNNTQIGMYKNVDNWIDEMTFQTGKEPVKLNNLSEVESFITNFQPVFVIIPKDVFDQLPVQITSKISVVAQRPFMSHSVNPGYIISHKEHLIDSTLLLVKNTK